MSERVVDRRLVDLAVWGVVAAAVVAGVMTLWWPLGHDQGIFALNGAVVAGGGQPYRDAFETRGPLAFYLYALVSLIFGPTAWGIRIVDLVATLGTAVALHRLVRPFVPAAVATVGAATWVFAVVALGHQDSAQFELWIGEAALVGTAWIARRDGYRARDLVAYGVLVGLASLTKQFYPVLLAVPGVVVLERRRMRVGAAIGELALLVVAWATPIALMVVWLWAHGLLGDMWEAHVRYTLNVYSSYAVRENSRTLTALGYLLEGSIMPTALAAAASGVAVLWRERRSLAVALTTLVACGLFVVVLQGRFFLYHWTVLMPAVAALAVVGCGAAARMGGVARTLGIAVGAGLVAQTAFAPLANVWRWGGYLVGTKSDAQYYAGFSVWQTNPADQRLAASYLHARTHRGDPIGMWAVDAAVPFLADRPDATRFLERRMFSLTADHELTRRYRAEYSRRVTERRPQYFVINQTADLSGRERSFAEAVPVVAAFVASNYVRDTTFGALEIWRRQSDVIPTPSTAVPSGVSGGGAR